jgi:hypothetical protein
LVLLQLFNTRVLVLEADCGKVDGL